jgi:hypothetical protein
LRGEQEGKFKREATEQIRKEQLAIFPTNKKQEKKEETDKEEIKK